MSFIDDIVVPLASSLLVDFGTPVTWTRAAAGTYVDGVYTPGTGASVSTRGVIENVPPSGRDDDFQLRKVTSPAADFPSVPTEGDTYVIGGVNHQVISASPVMAVDSQALMVAIVRQEKPGVTE